jgi:hypothetical protein
MASGADLSGRELTLNLMRELLSQKSTGRCHILVKGVGKVGKSSVLKCLANDLPCLFPLFVDIAQVVSTPQLFARNFLGQVLSQLTDVSIPFFSIFESCEVLLSRCSSSVRLALKPLFELLHTGGSSEGTLNNPAPDYYERLIEEVFQVPERIGKGLSKRVVMIYDNFEHILELSSYRDLKGILSILCRVMESHKAVCYVLSGNQSVIDERILKKKAFFRKRFSVVSVLPLDRENTYVFTSLLIGERGARVPREILSAIYRFTMGIPLYIKALCERAMAISAEKKESLSSVIIARAFVEEVLHQSGQIYRECHSRYFNGLSLVSGSNSLKAILQVLALDEGLPLAEIGRRIHRSNGQIHGYLKALVNADLIFSRDKKYYYSDPLLRFFVAQTFFARFQNSNSETDVLRCGGLFIREFLCNRPWLPYALYDRIESLALRFDGSSVDGKVFGVSRSVRLPVCSSLESLVGVIKDPSCEDSSQLMVSDLWIKGQRSHWIVEISTGNDLFTLDDYKRVRRKRTFFERSGRMVFDRLWIISETGFTEEFLEEAMASGVLCSIVSDDLESHLFPVSVALAA